MQELEAIEITTAEITADREQTIFLAQPHPGTILLSHFEVSELSPKDSSVELTNLSIEQRHYLLAPVPLALLQREQRYAQDRAEQQLKRRLKRLLGSVPLHLLQRFEPSRHEIRVIMLDVPWKSRQQLAVTFKNSGSAVVNKVVIKLILYAPDKPLPSVN